MDMESSCKVCVTGATGYIGSCLVKKLLHRGYTVHATLRDLKNESKVGLLRSFPQAQEKLVLFEANIYNPTDFQPVIEGCHFVFHVATPLTHEPGSKYKDTIEASLAGSRAILMSCVRAGTVKRLIYTASVVSASPLKDDGTAFKDFMDETCWTPLTDPLAYLYHDDFKKDYTYSKTLTEKYLLSYGNNENDSGQDLEVVTLACGLVGGDTLLSSTPDSVAVCVSQLTENAKAHGFLKFLQKLLGKIPLVHIDDVCEAHIFCMKNASVSGRFLCANTYLSMEEIANYYALHHPEFKVKQEYVEGVKTDIKWASTRLCDKGFIYKYDGKMTLDDCLKCASRMAYL